MTFGRRRILRSSRTAARRLVLFAAAALLAACGERPAERGAAGDPPLLVLAASDLQMAFEEIVPRFRAATGERVETVLGSTGNLAAQIRHGAPADLFFAANEAFLDNLVDAGRIVPESRRLYAVGRLALVTAPSRDPPAGVAALADPRYRVVAIANPEHAPYGTAAREALRSAGVWEAVRPRLVLGENVAQTYQFARTANADAAIVALSLVAGLPGGAVPHAVVPADLHRPLRQAAGIVVGSRRPEAGRRFLDFVLSEEGRTILARHGFEDPAGGAPR
jgi:molybdate transport system substrate-binding protein